MADYIRVEDLKNTTISIKKESERINDIYTNNIVKALENSQTELKVAGVNYDEMQESMKKVFTGVVNQINELTDAMNNIIIPKYEATSNVINRIFNQDFATEISDCIKAINSD